MTNKTNKTKELEKKWKDISRQLKELERLGKLKINQNGGFKLMKKTRKIKYGWNYKKFINNIIYTILFIIISLMFSINILYILGIDYIIK